jgi:sRNA-binding regulator protein Hfq
MADRKKRQGGGRGRGRPPHGRRTPPPASTGHEDRYLQQIKDARSAIVVTLTDGSSVHGVIEYFDRDMIKITRPEGPHFFARKSDIRYIREERED